MPTIATIVAVVALAAAVYAVVKVLPIMTLKDSLESGVAFVTEQRQKLQEAVAAIPQQVRDAANAAIQAAMDKAVADYIATHPNVEQIDGVTKEGLIAALQSITDDARSVLNNAEVIPTQIADAFTEPLPPL